MTIPRERFRALRWARNWLNDLASDSLVPPDVKAEAQSLLNNYPSDQFLRTAIGYQASLPTDTLEALSAASTWLFAFHHPTSKPDALRALLRHLPAPAEIAIQAQMQGHAGALGRRRLPIGDWIEPDEDYVHAFVLGWDDDCAVAVGLEWGCANDDELANASPQFLITSATSGVNYTTLKLGQTLRCTIERPWSGRARGWTHVKSCDAYLDATRADAEDSIQGIGPWA